MLRKRNKKAKMTTEVEEAPKKAVATKDKIVNADKMAEAVKTTGNDYQQYIRALFRSKRG